MSALVPVPFEFIKNELRKKIQCEACQVFFHMFLALTRLFNSIIQEHECYMTHKIILAPNIRNVVIHNNQINLTNCKK